MRMGSILGSPLDRIGYMLVPNDAGLMVAKKQQMLDSVVPSVQEYGSAPVYRERTFPLRPVGGYGERVQSSYGDKRYYWGTSIQVAGGLFGKGPLIHKVAATGANQGDGSGVTKFLDAPNPSVWTQFIFSGTKVYRRTDDTDAGQVLDHADWAVQITDAVLFQGGFSGATPSLYVCFANGTMQERASSGAWSGCTMPSAFEPQRLEVVGTELWGADLNRSVVRKVTSDPKVA